MSHKGKCCNEGKKQASNTLNHNKCSRLQDKGDVSREDIKWEVYFILLRYTDNSLWSFLYFYGNAFKTILLSAEWFNDEQTLTEAVKLYNRCVLCSGWLYIISYCVCKGNTQGSKLDN